ncbi:MAG: hypothetical protein ACKOLZ_04115 [Verrucomicrobiota bacterium]
MHKTTMVKRRQVLQALPGAVAALALPGWAQAHSYPSIDGAAQRLRTEGA